MKLPRQKNFVLPLLAAPAVMNTITGASLVQGGFQMAQSSRQAEEAEEQSREQVKAMNRIAKAAESNPIVAQQFLQQKQKGMSFVSPNTMETAKGFAKDIGKFALGKKKEIASGLLMGGSLSGAAYATDKAIQGDMKRNNILLNSPQQNPQQKSYAQPSTSVMAGFGKKAAKFTRGVIKDNWKSSLALGTLLGAGPLAANYMADRSQYRDQLKNTSTQQFSPQQKSYAFVGKLNVTKYLNPTKYWNYIKGLPGEIKAGWNVFKQHPGRSTLDSAGKIMGGGKAAREKMVEDLGKIGKESGNSWTKATADFLDKHKKTASLAATGVGAGIMTAGWNQGEKLTKAGLEKIDNNAFAYQKSKEQQL